MQQIFSEDLKGSKEKHMAIDPDFPEFLLHFSPNTDFHNDPAFLDGRIVLQVTISHTRKCVLIQH